MEDGDGGGRRCIKRRGETLSRGKVDQDHYLRTIEEGEILIKS